MEELLLSSPLAAEILEKHRNSKQPGSQHLCAAVVAITSYINDKELDPSPAAFFAAIMSTLDDLQGRSSGEVSPHLTRCADDKRQSPLITHESSFSLIPV